MVEPRENRVHMMLSNSEMEAIDDWRFANRIATRSDAIRRLCQVGLNADKQARDLKAMVQAAMDWTIVAQRYLPKDATHGEAEGVAPIEQQTNLFTTVVLLHALRILDDNEHHDKALKEVENFDASLKKAIEYGPDSEKTWKYLEKFYREWRERFGDIGIRPSPEWIDSLLSAGENKGSKETAS